MRLSKKWIITAVLLLFCLAIHLFSNNTERVENNYTSYFFVSFSKFLRYSFGSIPFSIGDILYGIAFIFLVKKIFKLLRFLFSKERRKKVQQVLIPFLLSTINFCSVIYILFNIFWGINYNRQGIATQLNLQIEKYTLQDLKNINKLLVDKINVQKGALVLKNEIYPNNNELFKKVENAYLVASKKYPYLKYDNVSIKSSLWGWLGNYVGFEGYYNPFTGEAQINTTVPKFTQPFTACHEVAHQLGYAKEMEANFVGYLAATASIDTLFKYSVYAEMFLFANRTLFIADSSAANGFKQQLYPAVLYDFKERRKFYANHKSFLEPLITYVYGKFLEHNQQPMGMLSYDEVTVFLIAYYKRYGEI